MLPRLSISLILYAFLCSLPTFQAQSTLLELLANNPDTSSFRNLVKDATMEDYFNKATCVFLACPTVFVPNNNAISNLNPRLSTYSKSEKINLIKQHMFQQQNTPLKGFTSNWAGLHEIGNPFTKPAQVSILKAVSSDFDVQTFLAQVGSSYFVNQAKIIAPNKEGSGGVIQVVDKVLFTDPKMLAADFINTLLEFMNKDPTLSTSMAYFQKFHDALPTALMKAMLTSGLGSYKSYGTFFVPNNAAWEAIPQDKKALLDVEPKDELFKVIQSHIIVNSVIYPSWASPNNDINTNAGVTKDESNKLFNYPIVVSNSGSDNLYVSCNGVSARITKANQPIKYGVVHIIDRPLGIVHGNKRTLLQKEAPAFLDACDTVPACKAMVDSDTHYTIFAPKANIGSPLRLMGVEERTVYLDLHFYNGKLDRNSIVDQYKLDSEGNGKWRFRVNSQGTFLEGRISTNGYVAGQVTNFDLTGSNGVIYTVDHIIGYPTETIKAFVMRHPDLTHLVNITSGDFVPDLGNNGPYTLFAPNNIAMESMKMDSSANKGSELLSSNDLMKRVIRRLIVVSEVFLETKKTEILYEMANANWEDEHQTLDVEIAPGPIVNLILANDKIPIDLFNGGFRCTNGLVYMVSKVLYNEKDMLGAVSIKGSSSRLLLSMSGLLSLQLGVVITYFF